MVVVDTSKSILYVFVDISVDSSDVSKINSIAFTVYNNGKNLVSFVEDLTNDKAGLQSSIKKLEEYVNETVKCDFPGSDLIFITFNSWDFRVRLIGAARKNNIELPIWIRFPKLYDLKIEFEKYIQDSSIESLDKKNSLVQIMNTLDIKLQKDSSGDDQLNLDSSLNSSEMLVCSYIKIFEFLKTVPNKDLLKTPYNYGLDYSQFIQEKSSVVYLSNIPLETEISTIKAWIIKLLRTTTSANSLVDSSIKDKENNIKFRSIQSLEKSCESGFIIFSSHQQALDFLQFNGNIFEGRNNTNTIEIQPSSGNLVDYASDILVPLSKSKNESGFINNDFSSHNTNFSNMNNHNVRPGDWNCPSCGFSNFQRRTACLRCSFPVTSAMTVTSDDINGNNLNYSMNGSTFGYKNNNNNNYAVSLSRSLDSLPLKENLANNKMNMSNSAYGIQSGNNHANYSRSNSNNNNNLKDININGSGKESNNNAITKGDASNASNSSSDATNSNNNYITANTILNNNSKSMNDANNSNFNNGNIGNNQGSYKYNSLNNTNNNNGGNGKHGYIPFRAGDWKCENCSYHNFAKNIYCLRCGISRVNNNIGANSKLVSAASSMILPGMNSFSNGFYSAPTINNSSSLSKNTGHQNGNQANVHPNLANSMPHLLGTGYSAQSNGKTLEMNNVAANSKKVDEMLSWTINQLQVGK